MAVAFDSVGPSSAGTGGTGATTLSWTHTTIGASCLLLVGAEIDSIAVSVPSTATCDGASMTSVGIRQCSAGNTGYCQVFSISGIAAGAHTIVLTPGAGAGNRAAGSIAFTGAGGLGTVFTAQAAGSVSVTASASGNLIAGFIAAGDAINSTTAPSTSRYLNNLMNASGNAAGNIAGATSPGTGSSVTMAWGLNTANSGGIVAVEVQQPAGAVQAGTAMPLRSRRRGRMRQRRAMPLPPSGAQAAPPRWSLVNAGTAASSPSSTASPITVTCPSTTAHNLLVLPVCLISASGTVSLPAGWVQARTATETSANTRTEIWYYPDCPAGITSVQVAWTGAASGNGYLAQILEFHDSGGTNVGPLDVTGALTFDTASPAPVATSAGTGTGQDLAVSILGLAGAAQAITVNPGPGFTQASAKDQGSSVTLHAGIDYDLDAGPAGTTVTDTVTWNITPAGESAVIVTFAPAGPSVIASAGAATVGAVAPAPPMKPYITGLAGTPGTGYFVDQTGLPVFMLCDAGWGLAQNAGRWNSGNWQAEIDNYVATRAAQGFKAILTNLVGTSHSGNPDDTGNTWDGVAPFTSAYTTLNNTYWQRVDYLLASAQAQGITVVLVTLFTYSLSAPANIMFGINSGTNPHDYGLALGNRYKNTPNIIWHFGDDYDGSSFPAVFSGTYQGIRDAGDTHIAAIENTATGSTSRYSVNDASHTSPYSWGNSNASYQWTYYYGQTYFSIEYAYLEPSPLPVLQADGMYWGEVTGGNTVNDREQRRMAWWAVSSGSRGYGTAQVAVHLWNGSSAPTSMGDGNWFPAHAENMRLLMESLPNWHLLIPDTSNLLITAGRGTRATYQSAAGQGSNYPSDTYVSGSRVPDGSLAVIYMSHATTITIDQTKMAAGYTATWVDPLTCATSSATPGSTYNSTAKGNNSAGDPDWVLVLQGPASATANAGVATAGAAAGTNVTQTANTANAAPAVAAVAAPGPLAASQAAAGPAPVTAQATTGTGAGTVPAGAAASAAVAPAGLGATRAAPSPGTVAAAGMGASAAETVNASPGAVLAVAPSATVTTSSAANAPAGVATVSALAPPALTGAGVNASAAASTALATTSAGGRPGAATITAAAAPALPAGGAVAGPATAPAVAAGPGIAETVNAAPGTVLAAAPAATVATSTVTNAPAGVASVSTVAAQPGGTGRPAAAVVAAAAPGARAGPITYRAGAVNTATAVAHTAAQTITVPSTVQAGDVLAVAISVFTFTPTGADFTVTAASGHGWTAVGGGLRDSGPSGGLNLFGRAWKRVATAGDASDTLTFAFTGTQGATDQFWWAIAIVAYANAQDVEASNGASGHAAPNVMPSVTTATDGDWQVAIGCAAVSGSNPLAAPPSGLTSRQNTGTAGIDLMIADSAGGVGNAGTSIGAGAFTGSGGGTTDWWADFVLALTPLANNVTATAGAATVGVAATQPSVVAGAGGAPPAAPVGVQAAGPSTAVRVNAGAATVGAQVGGLTGAGVLMMKLASVNGTTHVETWTATCDMNSGGSHAVRILRPQAPPAGTPHAFLHCLPVDVEGVTSWGSALDILQAAGYHDKYNVTLVEPTFGGNPWYADHPADATLRHESYTVAIAWWCTQNISSGGQPGLQGNEAHHLIGFSKSGLGGYGLLANWPGVYGKAALWDTPFSTTAYDRFGSNQSGAYGTQGAFAARYETDTAHVTARAGPLQAVVVRLWLGHGVLYPTEMAAFDTLLTGIPVRHFYDGANDGSGVHEFASQWVLPGADAILPATGDPSHPGHVIASPPTPSVGALAGVATVGAVANPAAVTAVSGAAPNAGAAAVGAQAAAPAVAAGAQAGAAPVLAVAPPALVGAQAVAGAGVATVGAVSPGPVPAAGIPALAAPVTAAAPGPAPAAGAQPGAGTVLTVAPGASVQTVSQGTANAGVATVGAVAPAASVPMGKPAAALTLVSAPGPVAAVAILAGVATVGSSATAAGQQVGPVAGVAAVRLVAPQPPGTGRAGVAVVSAASAGAAAVARIPPSFGRAVAAGAKQTGSRQDGAKQTAARQDGGEQPTVIVRGRP